MIFDRSGNSDPREQKEYLDNLKKQTDSQKKTESLTERMIGEQRDFINQAERSMRMGQKFNNKRSSNFSSESRKTMEMSDVPERGTSGNTSSGMDISENRRNQAERSMRMGQKFNDKRSGNFSSKGRKTMGMGDVPESRTNGNTSSGMDISENRRNQPNSMVAKVMNFREGLVQPMRDFLNQQQNKREERERNFFKREMFQLSNVNKNLKLLKGRKRRQSLGQHIRSAFDDFLRAPIISTFQAIAPIIKGAFKGVVKGVGGILFGASNKKRTDVKAIDEQTEILRKGFINRERNMFEKIRDSGIIGAPLKSGLGALTGISEKRAKLAEKSMQEEGKGYGQLSLIEKAARRMHKSNINILDQTKSEQQEDKDVQKSQTDLLEIQNSSIMKLIVSERGWFDSLIGKMDQASQVMARGFTGIIGVMKGASLETLTSNFQNYTDKLLGKQDEQIYQNSISNSPWMTPYEKESLQKLDEQNRLITEGNEKEEMEPEKDKGGGLIGSILSKGWSGIKTLVPLLIYKLKPVVMRFFTVALPKLFTVGFAKLLGGVGLAAAIGYAVGTGINWLINWVDDTFNTKIGHFIGKITYYIVEGIKGAANWVYESVSSTWNWVIGGIKSVFVKLKNDALGLATSALTSIGSGLLSLIWKTFDWIGWGVMSTFDWLGGKLWDAIVGTFTWIGGKFKDLGEWLLEKARGIPVIGRFFGEGEEKNKKQQKEEEDGWFSDMGSKIKGFVTDAYSFDNPTEKKMKEGNENISKVGDFLGGKIGEFYSSAASETADAYKRGVGILKEGANDAMGGAQQMTGDLKAIADSVNSTNEENKKEAKEQKEELVRMRNESNEKNDAIIEALQNINYNSALSAAKAGSDGEEQVYLRKEQQFRFNGELL